MPILQLDSENADRNLTSLTTVLTHTPNASEATLCQALVELGDGTKNLDGTGGNFQFVITVGGQTLQPSPRTVAFSTAGRSAWVSDPFLVPANAEVVVSALSPNGADTDVDVTARLLEVGVASTKIGQVQLVDDAITSAKFDESTAYPLRANTLNLAMAAVITGSAVTGTLTTTQFTCDLTGYDNDRLIGRTITFTSGPLTGESADITDYVDGSPSTITVAGLTEAPTNGNTFVIA